MCVQIRASQVIYTCFHQHSSTQLGVSEFVFMAFVHSAQERWHEATSTLRRRLYWSPPYKIQLPGRPGGGNLCTRGLYVRITINFVFVLFPDPLLVAARSKAAGLLRLWIRIPPGSWTFVCRECCVLSGRGLCDGLITRPEESYRMWSVVVCVVENLVNEQALVHWGAVAPQTNKQTNSVPCKLYLHSCKEAWWT